MPETTTTEPEPFWPDFDDLDRLAGEWDPDAGDGLPGEAINDPDWLRKRLLALAFARAELNRLEAEIDAERARIEARAGQMLDPLLGSAARLETQLTQYHRSRIADEKRRGVKKPATMVKMVWGALRSGAGRHRVEVTDEAEAIAFMRRHKMHDSLIPPDATWRVNRSKAPGLVGEVACDVCAGEGKLGLNGALVACGVHPSGDPACDGGTTLRVLAPNGEPVPGLVVRLGERWFKVDTEPLA